MELDVYHSILTSAPGNVPPFPDDGFTLLDSSHIIFISY